MKSTRFLLACLLCCALALGACGGGDSDGNATANQGGGDGAAAPAEDAGSAGGTGGTGADGPAGDSGSQGASGDGGPQVPPELVKAISDGVGKGGYSAERVRLARVGESGDEAIAVVQLIGRTLDGQSVEAVLSRNKKGWKLEELAKFVEFDKAQLVEKYKIETEILPENFSPKIVRCLTTEFGKLPQAKMEEMYLDRDRSGFVSLGRICLRN